MEKNYFNTQQAKILSIIIRIASSLVEEVINKKNLPIVLRHQSKKNYMLTRKLLTLIYSGETKQYPEEYVWELDDYANNLSKDVRPLNNQLYQIMLDYYTTLECSNTEWIARAATNLYCIGGIRNAIHILFNNTADKKLRDFLAVQFDGLYQRLFGSFKQFIESVECYFTYGKQPTYKFNLTHTEFEVPEECHTEVADLLEKYVLTILDSIDSPIMHVKTTETSSND